TGENSEQAFHILKHHRDVEIVGYLDDNAAKHGAAHLGRPILGNGSDAASIAREHKATGAFVAIGNNHARGRAAAAVRKAGLRLVNAIHPQSFIDETATFGENVMVEMGAAVHAGARVGDGSFVMGGA